VTSLVLWDSSLLSIITSYTNSTVERTWKLYGLLSHHSQLMQ